MTNKEEAYLFGPFIGELYWECYRFAPYAIHLKKLNSDTKIIILTREDRFGLYGVYADICVPLRVKNEKGFHQKEFGLDGYKPEYYDTLKKYFYEKYKERFDIVDHFCPRIHGWHRKIKWQFPRDEMDYDFQPKKKICEVAEEIIKPDDVIVDHEPVGYINAGRHREINATDLFKKVTVDVVIEALKRCEFVIGNTKYNVSRLALLLKKPLISLNETKSDDKIHLLNPFETPVIKCKNIEEGVKIYENNFRPEESWSWKQRRIIHFNKIR